MFWRMGLGEDYLTNWYDFMKTDGIEKYKLAFPEPIEWDKTY